MTQDDSDSLNQVSFGKNFSFSNEQAKPANISDRMESKNLMH